MRKTIVTVIFIITIVQVFSLKILDLCSNHNQCPPQSSCKPNACNGYVCLCDYGNKPNRDFTGCEQASYIGGPCGKCLSFLSFCNGQKKCQCFAGTRTTNTSRPSCTYFTSSVGESCSQNTQCPRYSVCTNKTCVCEQNFRPKSDAEFWANSFGSDECILDSFSLDKCGGADIAIPSALLITQVESSTVESSPITESTVVEFSSSLMGHETSSISSSDISNIVTSSTPIMDITSTLEEVTASNIESSDASSKYINSISSSIPVSSTESDSSPYSLDSLSGNIDLLLMNTHSLVSSEINAESLELQASITPQTTVYASTIPEIIASSSSKDVSFLGVSNLQTLSSASELDISSSYQHQSTPLLEYSQSALTSGSTTPEMLKISSDTVTPVIVLSSSLSTADSIAYISVTASKTSQSISNISSLHFTKTKSSPSPLLTPNPLEISVLSTISPANFSLPFISSFNERAQLDARTKSNILDVIKDSAMPHTFVSQSTLTDSPSLSIAPSSVSNNILSSSVLKIRIPNIIVTSDSSTPINVFFGSFGISPATNPDTVLKSNTLSTKIHDSGSAVFSSMTLQESGVTGKMVTSSSKFGSRALDGFYVTTPLHGSLDYSAYTDGLLSTSGTSLLETKHSNDITRESSIENHLTDSTAVEPSMKDPEITARVTDSSVHTLSYISTISNLNEPHIHATVHSVHSSLQHTQTSAATTHVNITVTPNLEQVTSIKTKLKTIESLSLNPSATVNMVSLMPPTFSLPKDYSSTVVTSLAYYTSSIAIDAASFNKVALVTKLAYLVTNTITNPSLYSHLFELHSDIYSTYSAPSVDNTMDISSPFTESSAAQVYLSSSSTLEISSNYNTESSSTNVDYTESIHLSQTIGTPLVGIESTISNSNSVMGKSVLSQSSLDYVSYRQSDSMTPPITIPSVAVQTEPINIQTVPTDIVPDSSLWIIDSSVSDSSYIPTETMSLSILTQGTIEQSASMVASSSTSDTASITASVSASVTSPNTPNIRTTVKTMDTTATTPDLTTKDTNKDIPTSPPDIDTTNINTTPVTKNAQPSNNPEQKEVLIIVGSISGLFFLLIVALLVGIVCKFGGFGGRRRRPSLMSEMSSTGSSDKLTIPRPFVSVRPPTYLHPHGTWTTPHASYNEMPLYYSNSAYRSEL